MKLIIGNKTAVVQNCVSVKQYTLSLVPQRVLMSSVENHRYVGVYLRVSKVKN
jgi:hypothetical protein